VLATNDQVTSDVIYRIRNIYYLKGGNYYDDVSTYVAVKKVDCNEVVAEKIADNSFEFTTWLPD
jgi:hypothetical protein